MIIYDQVIYQPLLNLLIYTYNILPIQDLGVVILVLTLLSRLAVWKPTNKSIRTQLIMKRLQPEMNALKVQFKDDPTAQFKAQQALQKTHGVSTLSSCLPLLIQLPFLIALYQVFQSTLKGSIEGLYAFVQKPEHINTMFLGLVDLTKTGYILPVIAAAFQFWQARMLAKALPDTETDSLTKSMNATTQYSLPLVSLFVGIYLPSGLLLYWVTTSVIMILQQYYVIKKYKKQHS